MTRLKRLIVCSTVLGLLSLSVASIAADISMSDKRFLKNAAEAGHFEIEGSKLALKKSKDADIIRFAKMMVDDHTQAAMKVKELAVRG